MSFKVKFGGYDWIVLDEDANNNTVLLLAKESIGNMAFDENNSNNFQNGTLCKFLNGDFIKKLKANGADVSAIITTTIDLTSDDGLKDYGETTQKVFLLTCDMYRKYRSLIPNLDNWWWLATAYSTESNGYYPHFARRVYSDGSLDDDHACRGDFGVRPAMWVKCSALDFEIKTDKFADIATTELLEEPAKRLSEADAKALGTIKER